jgi:hypothetical protein
MSLRYLAVFCCLSCHCLAAETELGGPILGFLFDPANGLQPVQGISGALTIGAPLGLPSGIAKLVISPRQDYALATTASDPNLLRVTLGDRLSVEPLGIPFTGSDAIAVSPTGSAAAFYERARNRIQVITGLPQAATSAREFDLSAFPGELIWLAVNDSADSVIASLSGIEQNAAVVFGDGTARVLTLPQHVTAATFLKGSHDLLIADGPANQIYLLKDRSGDSDATLLAGEAQGIASPVAVAISRDGKRAFVANSGNPGIASIDLVGGDVTITPCRRPPAQLAPMNGNAVFRLTEPSAETMWLFDGDASEPQIVFVPPYRPASEDSAQ